MSFSVNFNNNATAALQTLDMTQKSLSQVQGQINSGLKIATSADNASTFAIAQTMRGDVAGLKAVSDNINLGQSTVAVATSAMGTIQSALLDIKSKVTSGQAKNVDLNSIQSDIQSDINTINSTVAAAQFNSVNLVNSSSTSLTVVSALNRVASSGASAETAGTIQINGADMSATGLGIAGIAVAGGDSATFTLGSTATLVAGSSFTLTSVVLDSTTGSYATNTAVFEFQPSGTSTSTAPVASTGTPPTGGTAVYNVILNASASIGTDVAALETKMQQAGYTATTNADGSFSVSSAGSLTTASTTATGFTRGSIASGASSALAAINAAIDASNTFNSSLGTAANQLTAQGNFVTSLTNTLDSGVSSLTDADLAAASAQLTALQTKNQLGIQALGIANQTSSQILSLFR
ncbi:MAG TPA: flagellin [Stellaceae bacterium]|nr:flagellin [Stellaceae bacterium]